MAGKQASTAKRIIKAVALGMSLTLSAYLISVALRAHDFQWLGWIGFLPLFVVVRSLRPRAAVLAGEFWGGCLYLFCFAGQTPAVDTVRAAVPSPWLLALLIVIPAVYVGLAAQPTRSFGFKLLTLALGWTLLEAVLHVSNASGPHEGLLADSQGEGRHLHWFTRLLGYVSAAFLVALTNASLVVILSGARVSFPPCLSFAESPKSGICPASQTLLHVRFLGLRQAYPRAPPRWVAVLSWNPVGGAHCDTQPRNDTEMRKMKRNPNTASAGATP